MVVFWLVPAWSHTFVEIPLSRTTLFDNSFTCSAPKLWNALPQMLRASGSLVTFKKNLKHYFNSFNQRDYIWFTSIFYSIVLLDFLVTVKSAPNECVIRTGQP